MLCYIMLFVVYRGRAGSVSERPDSRRHRSRQSVRWTCRTVQLSANCLSPRFALSTESADSIILINSLSEKICLFPYLFDCRYHCKRPFL